MNKVSSAIFLIVLLFADGRLNSRKHDENLPSDSNLLVTTLYKEKCVGDNYTIYVTPIGICYNGMGEGVEHPLKGETGWNEGFGTKNPYGENDILDTLISEGSQITGISRSFYHSTNSSCTGGITDSFPDLPLSSCIGPFGEPFPWGTLELVTSSKDEGSKVSRHS